MRNNRPEVVVVPRGDSSAKWFLWGALAGAVVALLYTPSTGEQTRRAMTRRLRKLRALTEEKVDDLLQSFGDRGEDPEAGDGAEVDGDGYEDDVDELDDAASADLPAEAEYPLRVELEQRLKDARARRRSRRKEEAAD